MRKRMLIMLAAVVVVVGSLGLFKFRQIQTAMAQGASFQPPPESITTVVTSTAEWTKTIGTIGSVAAVHGVIVSADLPGVVKSIHFESGRPVAEGEVLVRLDVRQEQAQLTAAEARLELGRLDFDRARGLLERKVISQSEFDRAQTEYKQAEASVAEATAAIDRKTIRAPFSGVLGIRQVNLGQYLSSGDPIVPLQSLDPVYVNFSVPQQDAGVLRLGAEVRASADSVAGSPFTGRLTAINSLVDEATRNLQVQATFHGVGGRLRPGMFVDVQFDPGERTTVIPLPASAIHYAPYGNSVFVVSELKDPKNRPYKGVSQRFVQVGRSRGDQIAVTSGLKAGEEVATSGVFKLRPGGAIVVNNKVQPANDPAAKPEDS